MYGSLQGFHSEQGSSIGILKEIRNLSSGAQDSDILADDIYKNMTRLLSREDRPPKRWAQKTGLLYRNKTIYPMLLYVDMNL